MAFNPKSAYAEKLRDPRWQKKRLEVMQRDDFTCQFCGDKETTLNVHHLRYKRGAEPWEYGLPYLITLCEPCHHDEAERKNDEEILLDAFAFAGLSRVDLNGIACDLVGICMQGDRERANSVLKELIKTCDKQYREHCAARYTFDV